MSNTNNRDLHMRQAASTIMQYAIDLRRDMNGLMGEGFCETNPELFVKLINSCAIQYCGDVLADAVEKLASHQSATS